MNPSRKKKYSFSTFGNEHTVLREAVKTRVYTRKFREFLNNLLPVIRGGIALTCWPIFPDL